MTIRHLKIFIAVVECGTMSTAAQKLYLTQPSVSQAVRELEEHYHTPLFERFSRKLFITEAGKICYGYAKQVISQFDQMEKHMTEALREHLRIGATVSVSNSILPEIVKDLHREQPALDIYCFGSNTHVIEEKLLNMELDVGIVEGSVKSPDLVSIPLVQDFMVLACSMEHPFAGKDVVHSGDLRNQEFVMRESGSGTRELFETYLERHQVPIKIAFEENTPGAILKAVHVNQCMAVLSVRLIEDEVREGKLRAFQQQEQEWNRYFSLVYHKDKMLSQAIVTLKSLLEKYDRNHELAGVEAGILKN